MRFVGKWKRRWRRRGREGPSARRSAPSAGRKSISRKPKPPASPPAHGFGLPVYLHEDKMRRFAPVRSLIEGRSGSLSYCLDSDSLFLPIPSPCVGTATGTRVRVRDICVARLSDALHIRCTRKLGKVTHPTLEDERRP